MPGTRRMTPANVAPKEKQDAPASAGPKDTRIEAGRDLTPRERGTSQKLPLIDRFTRPRSRAGMELVDCRV